MTKGPHGCQPVVAAGAPLGQAPAAVVMVHGRGAAPANILDLVPRLARPALTYLAPAAANGTWYPHSFMADIATNEPGLSSGLGVLASLVARIEDARRGRSSCESHNGRRKKTFVIASQRVGRTPAR